MEVQLSGAAAHSSRPDLGINAIESAAEVVAAVREVARELASEARADLPEMDRPWVAVNVARITGGSAINIVPDGCTLQIGYRPLPGMPPESVFERIRQRVEALALPGRADCRILRVTPSMLTPDGTALQALLQHHSPHHGCGAASFATDGGNLARLGVQPLVFGPGSIEVAHQANEHVPIAQLHRAVDVIEQVVRARCG